MRSFAAMTNQMSRDVSRKMKSSRKTIVNGKVVAERRFLPDPSPLNPEPFQIARSRCVIPLVSQGSGHFMMLDNPDGFHAQLAAFITAE